MANEQLTNEQLNSIYKGFTSIDTDSSGTIKLSELQDYLGEYYSSSEVEVIIKDFDKDGNGTVDFAEFFKART